MIDVKIQLDGLVFSIKIQPNIFRNNLLKNALTPVFLTGAGEGVGLLEFLEVWALSLP